jgi:Putative transposase DNA-binding domain/Helix-turn-helix domain
MFAIKRSLKLNNQACTLLAKHAGFRRVVFNMGLSLRTQMYSEGKLSNSKVINEVKKVMYGANLVLVDQWFPSSKTCSNCGHKKDRPHSSQDL